MARFLKLIHTTLSLTIRFSGNINEMTYMYIWPNVTNCSRLCITHCLSMLTSLEMHMFNYSALCLIILCADLCWKFFTCKRISMYQKWEKIVYAKKIYNQKTTFLRFYILLMISPCCKSHIFKEKFWRTLLCFPLHKIMSNFWVDFAYSCVLKASRDSKRLYVTKTDINWKNKYQNKWTFWYLLCIKPKSTTFN